MINVLETVLEINNTILADKRNKMAKFMIYLTIISLGISVSSMLSSLLGMNVPNGMENFNYAFVLVASILFIIFTTVFLTIKIIKFKF